MDLHTHLSKVCIYAIPVHHTLMRQLFRQQLCKSIGGDATEFAAVGLTWLAGPQRGRGRQGGISHYLMKKTFHISWQIMNSKTNLLGKRNELCKSYGMHFKHRAVSFKGEWPSFMLLIQRIWCFHIKSTQNALMCRS